MLRSISMLVNLRNSFFSFTKLQFNVLDLISKDVKTFPVKKLSKFSKKNSDSQFFHSMITQSDDEVTGIRRKAQTDRD